MKKLISAVLSAAICFSSAALPMVTAAGVDVPESISLKTKDYGDDKCGVNAHWKLEGGTLTVSGSGAMADWEKAALSPWYERMGEIHSVVIEEGITSVGRACFYNASGLTSVKLPSTITTINMSAFEGAGISSIDIPAACGTIGDKAFFNCGNLRDIIIRNGNCKIVTPASFSGVSGTIIAPKGGTVENFAGKNNMGFRELTGDIQTQPPQTTTTTTTIAPNTSTTVTTTTVPLKIIEGSPAPQKLDPGVAEVLVASFSIRNTGIKFGELEFDVTVEGLEVTEKKFENKGTSGVISFMVNIPADAVSTYKYTIDLTKATDQNGNDILSGLPWQEKQATIFVNSAIESTTTATTTTSSAVTTTTTTPAGDAKFGDVNMDSVIDARDATLILTEYAKSSSGGSAAFSSNAKAASVADVNDDNVIDARDATVVCTYYAYLSVDGNPYVDLKTWFNNK